MSQTGTVFSNINAKTKLMDNEKKIDIINDLIRINKDRIDGYKKAMNESKDENEDLKMLFEGYVAESRQFVQQLSAEVKRLGGKPATDTTSSGKIYRVWMDLKVAVSGDDRKAILASCEYGEDAAQKAYDTALHSDVEFDQPLHMLIVRQQTSLKEGHDEVKRLRDLQKASR